MSTNFYWKVTGGASGVLVDGTVIPFTYDDSDPKIHIGKRYAAGGGRIGFIWAQEKENVFAICTRWPYLVMAVDEYGKELNGRQLKKLLEAVDVERESHGIWFS
jgi:hypothetical protein